LTAAKRSVVVGIFDDSARAEAAIRELLSAGFKEVGIGFAMRQPSGQGGGAKGRERGSGLGTLVRGYTGAAAGGVLGGLLGLAISAALPGIGPVFAAGAVGRVLGDAYVGGLVGALVGMGISHEEAVNYHRQLQAGRTLLVVKAQDRCSEALVILSASGALDALLQPEQTATIG
jgi:hypothetical protein